MRVEAGCTLVETGSWPKADPSAFIVGLKELPEEGALLSPFPSGLYAVRCSHDDFFAADTPLTHRHVFFGHCFKQQNGWKELLHRFTSGKGTLLVRAHPP